MSEQKYELAFYGKLVEGCSLQQTKEQVAQLFKTGVDQIERMFTGNRVVIRNKLDAETASKYIIALRKRGALCQIEEMGKPGSEVTLSDTPSVQAAPTPLVQKPDDANSEPAVAAESQVIPSPSPSPVKKSSAKAAMSVNGLPIVGDKVDEILRASHFDLAPVGVRLEDEKKKEILELHALDNVDLAPVGSILVEHRETPPVSVPDTSHIKLEPKD
jgi:hypothetical protein